MSSTSDNCKDGASKSNDDGVCELEEKLQNIMVDTDVVVSVCANCGKEGDNINNICNKCKMVMYCNAACKKKHEKKHKKDCEEHRRRAAELHDIELFKQPPPQEEDCPICFLLLPSLESGRGYKSCCGKVICNGCVYAPLYDNQGNEVDNEKCPFCRVPTPSSDVEAVERVQKRIEKDDPIAMHSTGCYYSEGEYGHPQDYKKALELFNQAGELGCALAYNSIGVAYFKGRGEGVNVDKKKSIHYLELAAMKGDMMARHNLGCSEGICHYFDRALKHYMIAVKCGYTKSLNQIKKLYTSGHATKDDYTEALQSYQTYLGEIKSRQRDEAAAFSEEFRYY